MCRFCAYTHARTGTDAYEDKRLQLSKRTSSDCARLVAAGDRITDMAAADASHLLSGNLNSTVTVTTRRGDGPSASAHTVTLVGVVWCWCGVSWGVGVCVCS